MLKGHCATHHFFIIALILLSIKITIAEKVANCHQYKISGLDQVCAQCMYGYNLDENDHCNPKTLVKVISLMMSVKYMEPFITFRIIFCDFMGEYWFLASNQSHSFVLRELTQFMIAINNERLWPFNIKEKFQLLVGSININKFHHFLGLKDQLSQRDLSSIKRDLFIFEKREFAFTSSCVIRLLCSLAISLAIWFGLQLVEGIIYFLTNKRFLEKKSIKGSFLLMITGQLYHFVGFYGFYQLRSLQGFSQFGIKISIIVTLIIFFLFGFLSIILLPIIYHANQIGPQKPTSKQSTTSQSKEVTKVHRVLTFANTPLGYTYYLIHGPFRQFCSGCFIGYFYDGNTQYIVLAVWYGIEYLLLEEVDRSLSEKVYFLLRKGYVLGTIMFLLLLFEENTHVFSQPDYSFLPVLEISICFLYIIALGQFLLQFIEIVWRFLTKIKNWLKIRNKVYNTGSLKNLKQKSAKRKLMREPSIADKVLTTLKTIKGL